MSAMRKYTKKEAVSIAIQGARLYRKNFAGRNLLFILTDKHKRITALEVEFDASNFMHLTGLRPVNKQWSSLDFYNRCLAARIKENEIEFSTDGSTHQKLAVLLNALKSPSLSASMVGDYNNSRPYLISEKMAGGVKWAIGFRKKRYASNYVPVTLLEGDIRELITTQYRVIAVYQKLIADEQYEQCVYTARRVDWDKLSYPDDWGGFPKPKV